MNLFQSLNSGALLLIVVALLNGVKDTFMHPTGSAADFLLQELDTFLFMFFYILLKIKITFDDHKHFGQDVEKDNNYRGLGFILAFSSWFVWGLAGSISSNIPLACAYLAVALTISSSWIVVHLLEVNLLRIKLEEKDFLLVEVTRMLRERWIITNIMYIFVLAMYYYFSNEIITSSWWLGIGILVLLTDILLSKPFSGVIAEKKSF